MRALLLSFLFIQLTCADWILDLMEEYTDNNIDPCDDFYKHTCGNTKTVTMQVVTNRFREDMKDYEKGDTSGFDAIFERLKPEQGVINKHDNVVQNRLCNYATTFMPKFRIFIGTQDDCWSHPLATVPGYEQIVEDTAHNVQVYNWITANGLHEKLEVIFNHMKEMIREEVEKTSWMDTYNVKDTILNRMAYLLRNRRKYEEKLFLEQGPVYLEECLSYNESLRDCLSTVASAYKAKYDIEFFFSDEYNAAYFAPYIWVYPSLYELIYHRSPFSIITLLNIINHEFGHLVFSGIVDNRNVTEPSSLTCVNQAMKDVCELFTNQTENENYCQKKADTIHEDIADFMEIMMFEKVVEYSYRSHLKSTNKVIDNEMAKKLLKVEATIRCGDDKISLTAEHSSGYHRANVIAKQSKLFQETYKCKPGDRMYASHENLCIVTGKEAPSTKKFFEENILFNEIF